MKEDEVDILAGQIYGTAATSAVLFARLVGFDSDQIDAAIDDLTRLSVNKMWASQRSPLFKRGFELAKENAITALEQVIDLSGNPDFSE